MKAWELTKDLLRNTKPVVRTEEEQTWDASQLMSSQDAIVALFWKSNVPGSAAPEYLMAAALQSLENKGYVLAPYNDLLDQGYAALAKGDFETLYVMDTRLRTLMAAAQPDPNHPSQKTLRYGSWEEFDAATNWPATVAVDSATAGFTDRIRGGWLAQLVGAAELEVLDQDVGLGRQLAHQRQAGLVLQVDGHRALVAVAAVEVGGVVLPDAQSPVAGVVAALGVLHLDHVGAQVGQGLAAQGAGHHARQVEHAHAGQGLHQFSHRQEGRERGKISWRRSRRPPAAPCR